jgi:hypothetical protein
MPMHGPCRSLTLSQHKSGNQRGRRRIAEVDGRRGASSCLSRESLHHVQAMLQAMLQAMATGYLTMRTR